MIFMSLFLDKQNVRVRVCSITNENSALMCAQYFSPDVSFSFTWKRNRNYEPNVHRF